MTIDKYNEFLERTKKDFPDLVKDTQAELKKSKSKSEDFAILSVFSSKLLDLGGEKWSDSSILFCDDEAMMPMPESVLKQFVSMLFKIKHLNPLYDLGIWTGFAYIQDYISEPTKKQYEQFRSDCKGYATKMFRRR